MTDEIRYINIREALSRTLRHPLLQDVTLEQAIQYVIDFIGIFGLPQMYAHKEALLSVEEFKCELPCDLISIEMVKEPRSGLSLRYMTDVFNPNHGMHNRFHKGHELSFKTQGRTLFTSFPHGKIVLSYLAISVDEDGLPLLLDDPVYQLALDAYIKREVFTVLFDQGKIQLNVLQSAELRYASAAGRLETHFKMPSLSEMESITRMWNQLIPRQREFDTQFEGMGNREGSGSYSGSAVVVDLVPAKVEQKPIEEGKKDTEPVIVPEGNTDDDPDVRNETLIWED